MTLFPALLVPLECFKVGRRQSPQFECGGPQAKAEDDASGLGSGMCPNMRPRRRAGRRANCGNPTRIARLSVLLFLADRVGVERGLEAKRTEPIDLRHRNFVRDPTEGG